MPQTFPDSRKRIARAILHAKEIVRQWNGLFNPDKYETVIERRGHREYIAKAIIEVAPENDLALELGEFFYQLRASLDGVFWESSILQSGCDPPPNENRVEFPLYESEDKFKNSVAYKGDFPAELKEWLQKIQPYNVGKSDDPEVMNLVVGCKSFTIAPEKTGIAACTSLLRA